MKVHVEKISTTVRHGTRLNLELHIDDVELAYTKRPFDSDLSLLISTLSVCDQTREVQDEAYMTMRSFPVTDQWSTGDALIMVQVRQC